jgi:uncharacterized protein YkwD
MRAGAVAMVAALSAAGCSHPILQREASKPAPAPDPKTQMRPLEFRVMALVQQERQTLNPESKTLMLDPVLMDVARKRARDMAAKGYFADAAPDGTTSATLVMSEDANFQGLLGVNIAAQHYTAQAGVDPDTFAQRFLDTWLKSPSHKQNLAFADYNRTGVGAALTGDTVIVVQLFATNLGLPPPKDHAWRGKPTRMASPEAAKTAMELPRLRARTLAQ